MARKKIEKEPEQTNDVWEIFNALNDLSIAKQIDKDFLVKTLESALASAFKKETGESRAVEASFNEETGKIRFYAYQKVVEGDHPSNTELSLEEARDIKPDAEIGEIIGEDITPRQLSRISIQTAKQVFSQKITEKEREENEKSMSDKEGELVFATIRRIEGNVVYAEITSTQMEGVMKPTDQSPNDEYHIGDHIKVYVKKLRVGMRNTQVLISRSCAGFVRKLFESEVPELKNDLVKVKDIVREAGNRTKMVVTTDDPNIDPLACCIGLRGERVNSIVSQLGGEKVDVILYTSNITEYIIRCLNPLKSVISVKVDPDNKKAEVIVADNKLSLAIGKGGQNAKLASRLVGMKLDIKPMSAVAESESIGE